MPSSGPEGFLKHLRELSPRERYLHLDATWTATSPDAADQLATWLRAADPSLAVRVEEWPATSPEEIEANLAITPFMAIALEPSWAVRSLTQPRELSDQDIHEWFAFLRSVPKLPQWKLEGLGMTTPMERMPPSWLFSTGWRRGPSPFNGEVVV